MKDWLWSKAEVVRRDEHKLINVEVLRDQMAELRETLERWVYQGADHRDWQIDQRAQGAERAWRRSLLRSRYRPTKPRSDHA